MDKQMMNEYSEELRILREENDKLMEKLNNEYEIDNRIRHLDYLEESKIIFAELEKKILLFFDEKSTLLIKEETKKAWLYLDEKNDKETSNLYKKFIEAHDSLNKNLEKSIISFYMKYIEKISYPDLINTLLEIQKSELESFTEENLRYQTKKELKGFEKLSKSELIIFRLGIEKSIFNKLEKNDLRKILFNHIELNSL